MNESKKTKLGKLLASTALIFGAGAVADRALAQQVPTATQTPAVSATATPSATVVQNANVPEIYRNPGTYGADNEVTYQSKVAIFGTGDNAGFASSLTKIIENMWVGKHKTIEVRPYADGEDPNKIIKGSLDAYAADVLHRQANGTYKSEAFGVTVSENDTQSYLERVLQRFNEKRTLTGDDKIYAGNTQLTIDGMKVFLVAMDKDELCNRLVLQPQDPQYKFLMSIFNQTQRAPLERLAQQHPGMSPYGWLVTTGVKGGDSKVEYMIQPNLLGVNPIKIAVDPDQANEIIKYNQSHCGETGSFVVDAGAGATMSNIKSPKLDMNRNNRGTTETKDTHTTTNLDLNGRIALIKDIYLAADGRVAYAFGDTSIFNAQGSADAGIYLVNTPGTKLGLGVGGLVNYDQLKMADGTQVSKTLIGPHGQLVLAFPQPGSEFRVDYGNAQTSDGNSGLANVSLKYKQKISDNLSSELDARYTKNRTLNSSVGHIGVQEKAVWQFNPKIGLYVLGGVGGMADGPDGVSELDVNAGAGLRYNP